MKREIPVGKKQHELVRGKWLPVSSRQKRCTKDGEEDGALLENVRFYRKSWTETYIWVKHPFEAGFVPRITNS